jgi:glutaryl-CoA dehydrogenase
MTDEGIRGFLLEKGTPGFSAPEIQHKFSLRASITSALFFDNVVVPEERVLPGVRGLKGPLACLTQARYGIAWGVIGAARACFDSALDYAKNRVQFGGKPIASHQLVQAKFAEMLTQITAAQLMALEVSRHKEEKTLRPQHVSMIKRNNVKMALDALANGTCRTSIVCIPMRKVWTSAANSSTVVAARPTVG